MIGEGSSLFVSFVLNPTGAAGDDFYANFTTPGSAGDNLVRFHVSSENDSAHTYGARYRYLATINMESGDGHAAGEPVLIVGKITMVPGEDNDTMQMWINPRLGLSERLGAITSVSVSLANE